MKFSKVLFRTTERMTYTDVYKIVEEKDEALIERYRDISSDV